MNLPVQNFKKCDIQAHAEKRGFHKLAKSFTFKEEKYVAQKQFTVD